MAVRGWVERHVAADGRVRWRARGVLHGERVSVGLYDTEDEAADSLAAWLAIHSADSTAHTLGSWGTRWLALRSTSGSHRAARTDELRWARYIAGDPIASIALSRLARVHVVEWADRIVRMEPVRAITRGGKTEHTARKGERLSAQTVRHAWWLLSGCLREACARDMMRGSPMVGLRCPRPVDRPRDRQAYVELDAIAALLALPATKGLRREADGTEAERITPAERSACVVAIYAGLRAGELWGLRWCDVRLDGSAPELHVRRNRTGPTKTRSARHVPLLGPAVEALRMWREVRPGVGEALVWPSDGSGGKAARERYAGGCHGKGYDAGWGRIRRLLGVQVRFHDLRHTCASHLVMGSWTGAPLELVQVRDWLGHESIKTTERYAHLRPGGLHDAARAPLLPHSSPKRSKRANVVSIGKTGRKAVSDPERFERSTYGSGGRGQNE